MSDTLSPPRHDLKIGELFDIVEEMSGCDDIESCWKVVTKDLAGFGFDRMVYARKSNADAENLHNLSNTLVLSTYGDAIDQLLIYNRGYVNDITTLWSLENQGAISWRLSRDRYLNGLMTKSEEMIHLATRELGLVDGYTYSNSVALGHVKSGFGLCFHRAGTQADADAIWDQYQQRIEASLRVFELTVTQMRNVPDGADLSPRQVEVLGFVAGGKTITDISDILSVHRRTVEEHLATARSKLNEGSTVQAVLIAARQGQI